MTPSKQPRHSLRAWWTSFFIGLLTGGLCVGLWLKDQSPKQQTVEVIKEVPVEIIKEVIREHPGNGIISIPSISPAEGMQGKQPRKLPKPGDTCYLDLASTKQLIGANDYQVFLIARDTFSLSKMLKYQRAGDGGGLLAMMERGEVLVSAETNLKVLVIEVDERTGTAEAQMKDGPGIVKDFIRTAYPKTQKFWDQDVVVPIVQLKQKGTCLAPPCAF